MVGLLSESLPPSPSLLEVLVPVPDAPVTGVVVETEDGEAGALTAPPIVEVVDAVEVAVSAVDVLDDEDVADDAVEVEVVVAIPVKTGDETGSGFCGVVVAFEMEAVIVSEEVAATEEVALDESVPDETVLGSSVSGFVGAVGVAAVVDDESDVDASVEIVAEISFSSA